MQKRIRVQNSIQKATGLLILILPLLIFFVQNGERDFGHSQLLKYTACSILFTGIYFLHSQILFRKLYLARRYYLYFLILAVLLACVIAIEPFKQMMSHNRAVLGGGANDSVQGYLPTNTSKIPFIDIVSIFTFLLAIIIGVAIETNKQLRITIQRALMAETEKAQAELAFLKAQVNPHFLFNTLNNIYTLALTKDRNTPSSILKLSNMMRYLTDEAGNDEVSLSKEISCITDYVELQRLRLTQKTALEFDINGNFHDDKIAPLILMAFIENVFKYGVSNHADNKLIIRLIGEHHRINLYCENTVHPEKKNSKRTGIGLENTKKRLQYIYPERHSLTVENNQKVFKINLSIHLN